MAINHFLSFSKSEFTAAPKSIIEFDEAVRFVLSANNRGLVLFRQLGKSLTYNKKINGPEIEPCGTPYLIKRSEEKKFFIWHFWMWFVRYDLSKIRACPFLFCRAPTFKSFCRAQQNFMMDRKEFHENTGKHNISWNLVPYLV